MSGLSRYQKIGTSEEKQLSPLPLEVCLLLGSFSAAGLFRFLIRSDVQPYE